MNEITFSVVSLTWGARNSEGRTEDVGTYIQKMFLEENSLSKQVRGMYSGVLSTILSRLRKETGHRVM